MPHPQHAAFAWRQLSHAVHRVRDGRLHLLPYYSRSVKSLTPCMVEMPTSFHAADIIKAEAQAQPTSPTIIENPSPTLIEKPSPTPQPAPTTSSSSPGLSTGEIVGIVIAVVLGIPSLVGGLYKFIRWWNERSQVKSPQPVSRRRSGRRVHVSYEESESVFGQ